MLTFSNQWNAKGKHLPFPIPKQRLKKRLCTIGLTQLRSFLLHFFLELGVFFRNVGPIYEEFKARSRLFSRVGSNTLTLKGFLEDVTIPAATIKFLF